VRARSSWVPFLGAQVSACELGLGRRLLRKRANSKSYLIATTGIANNQQSPGIDFGGKAFIYCVVSFVIATGFQEPRDRDADRGTRTILNRQNFPSLLSKCIGLPSN
jgi:hypothetical protein